jgi:hypothetical protein
MGDSFIILSMSASSDVEPFAASGEFDALSEFARGAEMAIQFSLGDRFHNSHRRGEVCPAPADQARLICDHKLGPLRAEAESATRQCDALAFAVRFVDLHPRPLFKLAAEPRQQKLLSPLGAAKFALGPLLDALLVGTAFVDLSGDP